MKDHCEMCGATRRHVHSFPLEPAFSPDGTPMTLCYSCRIGSAELFHERTEAKHLNDQELATVLAALRFWQSKLGPDNLPAQAGAKSDFGEYFENSPALSEEQIDKLCERLNS